MKGKVRFILWTAVTASSKNSFPQFCPRTDLSCIRAIFLYSLPPFSLYHQFPCIEEKKEKLWKHKLSLYSDASSKNKGTKRTRCWIKDTISIKKFNDRLRSFNRSEFEHPSIVSNLKKNRKGRGGDLLRSRGSGWRSSLDLRETNFDERANKNPGGKWIFSRRKRKNRSFIRRE